MFRNFCALNAIYNEVDEDVFKIINTCISAKKACETLEVDHEGTS